MWDCEIQLRGHDLRSVTVNLGPDVELNKIPREYIMLNYYLSLIFIKKKKRRWLTSSLKIYIPYLNSDCTIKYIIEKKAKCKLRKIQSNFIWIFLNVVDTDETLCCDAQKISRALHIVQVKKSVSLCAFMIENSVCVAQQHFQYSLVIVKD